MLVKLVEAIGLEPMDVGGFQDRDARSLVAAPAPF